MEPRGEDARDREGSRDRQTDVAAGRNRRCESAQGRRGPRAADRGRPAALHLPGLPQHALLGFAIVEWRGVLRAATGRAVQYRLHPLEGKPLNMLSHFKPVQHEPLLRVNMRAGYGKQTVLEDITFDLAAGERLGIV